MYFANPHATARVEHLLDATYGAVTAWLGHPSRSTMTAYPRTSTATGIDTGAPLKPAPTYPALGWLFRLFGWPRVCTTTTHVVAPHPAGSPAAQRIASLADMCNSREGLMALCILQVETGRLSIEESKTSGSTRSACRQKCSLGRFHTTLRITSRIRIRHARIRVIHLAG